MKEGITSKEDLIRFGKPLKELAELTGFDNLPELKHTLKPLKELAENHGFKELSSLKEIFTPVKDVPCLDSLSDSEKKEDKEKKES